MHQKLGERESERETERETDRERERLWASAVNREKKLYHQSSRTITRRQRRDLGYNGINLGPATYKPTEERVNAHLGVWNHQVRARATESVCVDSKSRRQGPGPGTWLVISPSQLLRQGMPTPCSLPPYLPHPFSLSVSL